MSASIADRILERIGQLPLKDVLHRRLSGTELNTVLLEVFALRTRDLTPPQLLNLYQSNRFVKPADLPVLALRNAELDLLALFHHRGFQPIELSPVAVLGACSVVAPADQKKILSALRGTEVLADATNSIALHVCDLKQTGQWTPRSMHEKLSFAAFQRHVRTQAINVKGFTPHFKIGCLATAGYDTGNFTFEKEALTEHLLAMHAMYQTYYATDDVSFRLLCRKGYPDARGLAASIQEHAQGADASLRVEIVDQPEKEIGYYKGIQYKVDVHVKGRQVEIADGGFVDWTQQLLQNRKERFLITGFGFELMYRILNDLM